MHQSSSVDPENPFVRAQVGDDISLPVVRGNNWNAYSPDQVVAVASDGAVALVLLAQEPRVVRQRARMTEKHESGGTLEIVDTQVTTQLTDIGHLRMTPDHAAKLATTIVAHLIQFHQYAPAELQKELTAALATPKSAKA